MNGNERRERNVLLQRTEINAENKTIFWKEWKWMWERNILLQKELMNVSFFLLSFKFFLGFLPFLNHFWPQKDLFWSFLATYETQMNETFLLNNGKERRVGHQFFLNERFVLMFICVHFKWTFRSLRSFPFSENEHFLLCVLFGSTKMYVSFSYVHFCSVKMNLSFSTFISIL